MSPEKAWTSPADIKAELLRHWEAGRILAARLGGEPLFPLRLRLVRPDARALSERFAEVRTWIRELEEGSGTSGPERGYQIGFADINHRQLGRNRVPSTLIVPTEADALVLISKQRQAERFTALVTETQGRCPALVDWIARHPMKALDLADEWQRLLSVVLAFAARPRPALYLRQLDIAGVDTKFIEARKALLGELLDRTLPASAIDESFSNPRQFEPRYGLLTKPAIVRFRLLDPRNYIRGMSDVGTSAADFAGLDLPVSRVFITENEINGLAFPQLQGSMVIFGLGYGLSRLASTSWLRDKTILYWGDIDTHGFAMLDRLRADLDDVRSFLMDRETLLSHRSLWVSEDEPYAGPLGRLTDAERALYDDLHFDRLGTRVRLEQERVGFGWLADALLRLG